MEEKNGEIFYGWSRRRERLERGKKQGIHREDMDDDDDDEKEMSWMESGWAGPGRAFVKVGCCMCVCGQVWDGTSL